MANSSRDGGFNEKHVRLKGGGCPAPARHVRILECK